MVLKFLHRSIGLSLALYVTSTLCLPFRGQGLPDSQQQSPIENCINAGEGLEEYQSNTVTLIMVEELRRSAQSVLRTCQPALALARQRKNRREIAAVLTSLGLASQMIGKSNESIEFLEEAWQLGRNLDNFNIPSVVQHLGDNYMEAGLYQKAVDLYQQRLSDIEQEKDPDRTTQAFLLVELGQAYFFLGNLSQAMQLYRQSLRVEPESWYTKLALAAALIDTENWNEAQKVLESALPQPQPITEPDALQFDWSRILEFEWSGKRELYSFLQQVLIAQGQPEKALEIAERSRAAAFTELLIHQLKLRSIDPTLIYKPSVQKLQQLAAQNQATIVQYSFILDHRQFGFRAQEKSLYIWVIPPQGKIAFRQVSLNATKQPLEQLVASSLRAMGVSRSGLVFREEVNQFQSRASSLTQDYLQELYQLLIQPISDLLPKDPEKRVIFIPQQSLFQVPFAALQDPTGNYLIQKHTILTAPAIRVLALTQQQRHRIAQSPGKTMLIVGDPVMPSVSVGPNQRPSQLAALPGAAEEARSIAALLGVQALIGPQATKAAILKQISEARIVHLATHGFMFAYASGNIMTFSGPGNNYSMLLFPGILALAPAGRDTGLLTTGEIVALKLKAELVVLSACETGRGEVFSDGVLGLARSFLLAGTPSVIVSLWQVPDAPTGFLMQQFYQNLQRQPDKAKALRNAMLNTLQEYPDPKAWAAFTLIGEAD